MREFDCAQGRAPFVIRLDAEYEYPFCECGGEVEDELFDSFFGEEMEDEEVVLTSKCRPLLGLGPRNTDMGDETGAVQGSAWPLVARPVDTGEAEKVYSMVGEAYVHGPKDGELLKGNRMDEELIII